MPQSSNNKSLRNGIRSPKTKSCFNCGNAWPHTDRPCPAKDQECLKCKRIGHFAKLCPSERQRDRPAERFRRGKPKVNQVDDSSSDEEYAFSLCENLEQKLPITNVKINNYISNKSACGLRGKYKCH